ncbi:hypothetical protein HO173_011192 [Letharia columbiana]|uniref:Uncharacterized protein n=1 Tax=Letharia columbiana TaxID=112416 RepID=A0A8H6L055_9LECA|nr:uncharacterized protein HO173_011192 [Letharia columbiana]KAF6230655.1 hypothetical protein HO173_011192 [Letharia columbiana]
MKLSSAAITVAAISLLSTTHAAPLAFKNGEITGHLHHRRGSDISDISSASSASEAIDDLDIGFEPGATLLLPRIFNFFKRQSSSSAAISTSVSPSAQSTDDEATSGTTDADLHTEDMTPDYESYGFASEGGDVTALAPVREVKE